jgi:hypothetical protein
MFLLLGATGCARSVEGAQSPGTIEGHVLLGPMCPVEQLNSPCPDQPFQATVEVTDGSGRVLASTRSDSSGRFAVDMAPGSYLLRIGGLSTPRFAKPVSVTVGAGQTATANLTVDSGIR